MKKLLFLTSLLLSSCAVDKSQIANDEVKQVTSVSQATFQCYKNLINKPEYAFIHNKIAVDSGINPTEAQLNDQEKVTPQAIQSGMNWFSENQECNTKTLNAWANLSPAYGAMVSNWLTEITDIMNDVITNQPTYGHINQRLKALNEKKRNDMRTTVQSEVQRKTYLAEQRQQQINSAINVGFQVLDVALQVLVARQNTIYNSQTVYYQKVPTYHPVVITQTACNRTFNTINCVQVKNFK